MPLNITVDTVDSGAHSAILVVGQSNAQERGDVADLEPEFAALASPHTTVRHCIYKSESDGTGEILQPWRFAQKNSNGSIGFDLSLAYALGGNRAILKWTMGGTASTFFRTRKADCVSYFQARFADYPNAAGLRPDWIVICQGESGVTANWIADWTEVVAAIRDGLGRQRIGVIVVQTSDELGGAVATLRTNQSTFVSTILHGALVPTSAATHPYLVSPHYGTPALCDIGVDLAAVIDP